MIEENEDWDEEAEWDDEEESDVQFLFQSSKSHVGRAKAVFYEIVIYGSGGAE